MVEKAQKSHGARFGLYGGCSDGVPSVHFFQAEDRIQFRSRSHAISGLFQPRKGRKLQSKKFGSDQQSAARFREVGGVL
jgi:phage/plasmid primase-like uncharacterized protein